MMLSYSIPVKNNDKSGLEKQKGVSQVLSYLTGYITFFYDKLLEMQMAAKSKHCHRVALPRINEQRVTY